MTRTSYTTPLPILCKETSVWYFYPLTPGGFKVGRVGGGGGTGVRNYISAYRPVIKSELLRCARWIVHYLDSGG